jgi:hypothetical protein
MKVLFCRSPSPAGSSRASARCRAGPRSGGARSIARLALPTAPIEHEAPGRQARVPRAFPAMRATCSRRESGGERRCGYHEGRKAFAPGLGYAVSGPSSAA